MNKDTRVECKLETGWEPGIIYAVWTEGAAFTPEPIKSRYNESTAITYINSGDHSCSSTLPFCVVLDRLDDSRKPLGVIVDITSVRPFRTDYGPTAPGGIPGLMFNGTSKGALVKLLQNLTITGSFAVGGPLPSTFPLPLIRLNRRLTKRGTSIHQKDLVFPLNDSQRDDLIEVCGRSGVGVAETTVINLDARTSWQVLPDQFSILNKDQWQRDVLAPILSKLSEDLGCAQWNVTAKLYKVLLYEEGCFFRRHRDNERINDMFGTLVIQLPSVYEGATLRVFNPSVKSDAKEFSFSTNQGMSFAAFYADCYHEVDDLTSGSRAAIVYSLCHEESNSKEPSSSKKSRNFRKPVKPEVYSKDHIPQPADASIIQQIANSIHIWGEETSKSYPTLHLPGQGYDGGTKICGRNAEPPVKLVIALTHDYTPNSLMSGIACLKGRDRVIAELLDAARRTTPSALVTKSLKRLAAESILEHQPEDFVSAPSHHPVHGLIATSIDENEEEMDTKDDNSQNSQTDSKSSSSSSSSSANAAVGDSDTVQHFDMFLSRVLSHNGEGGTGEATTGPLIPFRAGDPAVKFSRGISKHELDENLGTKTANFRGSPLLTHGYVNESPKAIQIETFEWLLADVKDANEAFDGHLYTDDPNTVEFLGNGGCAPDFWYSRAAIILWPKSNRTKVQNQSPGGRGVIEAAGGPPAAVKNSWQKPSVCRCDEATYPAVLCKLCKEWKNYAENSAYGGNPYGDY